MRGYRFWYRSVHVLGTVLALVDEEHELTLPDLVETCSESANVAPKTVRGAVSELSSAGVLWLSMPERKNDDRRVRFTLLGRLWWAQMVGEVPGFTALHAKHRWDVLERDLLEEIGAETPELGEPVR